MNAQAIVSSLKQLPSPSPAIGRLLELLQDPEGTHDEVIHVVKQDAVLTAKVLKRCNSAADSTGEPVGSINQAVFLLGYRKIFQTVMSLSFGHTLQRGLPGYAIESGELWRHSLLTALVSEMLTGQSNLTVLPSIAYTAGLLHDIGKTVLDRVLDQEHVGAIRQEAEANGIPWRVAERRVLETDHAEVGACLLRRWNFPDALIEAVELHHQPRLGRAGHLSSLVSIANQVTHAVDEMNPEFSAALEASSDSIGLTTDDLSRTFAAACERLEEIEQADAVA